MTPVISIVIPLYNKGDEILKTLDTVFGQTVSDYEILVVDDGSTDGGEAKVEAVSDARVRLIRKENGGVSTARNAGMKAAVSDLIAFLDADDEWDPDHLETLIRLRATYPEAGLYTTHHVRMSESGKAELHSFAGIPPRPWEGVLGNYFLSAIRGMNPVWTSACAVPKSVFADIGLFDEEMRKSQDVQLWNRIASKYPVAFSWSGTAYYRKDAGNRISKNRNALLLSDPERYLSKMCVDPRHVTTVSSSHAYAYNCKLAVSSAQYALLTLERPDIARRCLACVRHPSYLFPRYLLWTCLSRLPHGLFKRIRLGLRRMRGRG